MKNHSSFSSFLNLFGRVVLCTVLGCLLLGCQTTPSSDPAPEVTTAPAASEDAAMFRGEEWYDLVETVQVNREKAHSAFIPYLDAPTALANEASVFTKDVFGSSFLQSLNGTWDFYFAANPFSRLGTTWEEAWDTAGWDTIDVPSQTQLIRDEEGQFKYDTPIYINQIYPWANYEKIALSEYPTAPTTVNGVGHYKRSFTLNPTWDQRQVFVRLEGVGSAFYLFINGQRVGYAEDTWTTDEFNITPYLNRNPQGGLSGVENTIALQVYRWSTGSYLENQDMIRLSGVFRDVTLVSKDVLEIQDTFLTPHLDETYENGTLDVEVTLRNLALAEATTATVEVQLYPQNEDTPLLASPVLLDVDLEPCGSSLEEVINDPGVIKTTTVSLAHPELWTPDHPALYRVVLTLKDATGKTIEVVCQRIGFREVAVEDLGLAQNQITLNGVPLLIKGVNRHEFNLERGNCLTTDDILNDLMIMKQNNLNAFRTSHYPNQSFTYDVADELGLMVVDEANIESHYGAVVDTLPSHYPAWNPVVLDRTQNMVERDKNHASILFWSLGNESTYTNNGATLDESYPLDGTYCFEINSAYIAQRDPSRLKLYERDNRASLVDVYSSQYWSLQEIQDYCASDNTLPYLQSEYSHSMGNADGNLKEYWDLFRSSSAQGGFIWDFKDQALLQATQGPVAQQATYSNLDSQAYFSYGGDWGDTLNDLDFCGNGLLYADGTMSSKMIEVAGVLQNFQFAQTSPTSYSITNENYSTPLSDYEFVGKVILDGTVIQERTLNLTCLPQETTSFTFDLPELNPSSNRSLAFVQFEVHTTDTTNYGLDIGAIVAQAQFSLPLETVQETTSPTLDSCTLQEEEQAYLIQGVDWSVQISKETGLITSYLVKNQEVLATYPHLQYTRAPLSNDQSYSFVSNDDSQYAEILSHAQEQWVIQDKQVQTTPTQITLSFTGSLGPSPLDLTYTVSGNGSITLTNSFTPASSLEGVIPVIGMAMELEPSYDQVTYYGKGPWANYVDRNTASLMGLYHSSVADLFESKYLRPQENGNRSDVLFVALLDENQTGILVTGDHFSFTALPYSASGLASVTHPYELGPSSSITLTIKGFERGLGNAICGPLPLDEYVLDPGQTYTYSYTLIPCVESLSDETALTLALNN